ncbi:sugar ABC transporter permease [Microbacterium sp. cx-55]|uniref:carbohydrate ABC transporter permease n=1 Tax=unclassified Microbacterium TaxID=2609290 RepID=UPI001CBC4214|nr:MULTISPECIES: sugar ABC transporter permease [unclassified Microbacterium]MBZ4488231.1 sugar ABC transporter permease [Microbacterium sp. cx-55]MCC4909290.1 sugar ABC transporter permease [Microbacterium sp. cx-59]UGB34891.1 sugar ABC transporter permease [Microbacterium sp. cx-55]
MTTQTLQRPVTRRRSGIERRQRVGWLFITPFLVIFAAFLVFPLIYAFGMSLFSSTLATGTKFVGIDNYAKAFTDPLFLGGLGRVALFAIIMIPAQLIVALVAALVLDSLATWLSKLSRLLIFAPYAIPVVIGALMWSFLYSPRFGPGGTIFSLFGLEAPNFLASDSIFFSLVNIVTWQWAGYYMIVIYAALRSIDPAIYEAARIDGAGGWQIATRIKVPMISSSMVMVITFALIGTLQFFTEPTVLRSIASGALPAEYTPNMYAYALAFSYSQFNYAATIAFSLGILVFIGSFGFLFLTRKQNGLK